MIKAPPLAAWIALGILLLVSFAIDLENVSEGGSIDLRNRIVGVRLLAAGLDPYFYKWDETKPETYADPYSNPHVQVSKTTATPTLLLLHLPLAPLPYRLAQFLWFFAQWGLLIATGFIWWRHAPPTHRFWLGLFFVGLTFTAASRLHIERGQSYLLLLFVLASWLSLTLSPRFGNGFLSGLVAGWLVALRPPYLFILPFLALHRRGQLVGAALGLLLGFGLPLVFDSACWSHYFSAMQVHSEIYRNESEPRPGPQHFPATIEGVPTDTIAHYAVIPYADFSAHRFARWLDLAPLPAWPLLLIPALGFAAWLWWKRRETSLPHLLLGLTVWLFLADLFVPAYRNNYNDVLILNIIALGLMTAPLNRWALGCCFVALPLGWMVYFVVPETPWIINLPTLFFTLGAILFLIPAPTTPPPQRPR